MKKFPKTKKELAKCINAFIMTGMGTSMESFLSEYSNPRGSYNKRNECSESSHLFNFVTKKEAERLGIDYKGEAKWRCDKCGKIVQGI
jgi:hypothetical protein